LVPTESATGVEAAEAVMMEPLVVKVDGAITQAALSAIVPVEVIVPPVRPVPAVTEVIVPPAGEAPEDAAVIRPWASTVIFAYV
jgi:hypothetical protein